MKKIIITGGSGGLGSDLYKEITSRYPDAKVLLPDRDFMDIKNRRNTFALINCFKPDVVFHCAAYTNVDQAEIDEQECFEVNVLGTKNVVDACKIADSKLIYVSTDYVFDGTKQETYIEEDDTHPLNVYGKTKLAGEVLANKYNRSFIVRTSWLFGLNGNNYVKKIIKSARENGCVNIIGNEVGSPTYTKDLARLLVDIAQTERYGIYHAHNEGIISRYAFTKYILDASGIDVPINEISSKDYNALASRPVGNALSTSKLINNGFKPLPIWTIGVDNCVNEILSEERKKKLTPEDYNFDVGM